MKDAQAFIKAPIRLTGVNRKAIETWEIQWIPLHPGEEAPGGWDWRKLAEASKKTPAAFQVAIWSNEELCGLGVGHPSAGRHFLSLNVLEGSPNPHHPLKGKILGLVIATADTYARALDLKFLRLLEPFAEMLRHYREQGFSLAGGEAGKQYYERRVNYG